MTDIETQDGLTRYSAVVSTVLVPSIRTRPQGGGGWRLFGGRLAANVPAEVTFTPRSDDRDPLDIRVQMIIDVVDGRLSCTSLTAERLDESAPGITGEDLRRIPVASYVELATSDENFVLMKMVDRGEGNIELVDMKSPPEDFAKGGMTDEALDLFADLYAAVQARGGKPSGVLLSEYGMPRATFSRWLEAARRRGILVEEHVRDENLSLLGLEHHKAGDVRRG